MDYQYIDEIVKQLLSNTFSVFCGAGAVFDATHTTWKDIFSDKTKKFIDKKICDDIYLLADFEKRYYNCDNFYKNIKNKITNNNAESKHIKCILNLNLNQIWTTNFDEIIEKMIKKEFKIMPSVFSSSMDFLKKDINQNFLVYKLNGTISQKKSMILTKTDYHNYLKKQRIFFEFLKRQLVLDSFLFIGYSFKDDLVLNALREIKTILPHKCQTHYRFLLRENDSDKKQYYEYENRYFKEIYNIKTIEIDDYKDIDCYIEELHKRFSNYNVLICGSFRSIDNNERYHIEMLVDKLCESLFRNNFNIYSGHGRGLGDIVLARAFLHMKKSNNKFVNRPLIFTGDKNKEKELKNDLIIKDCNTMIIICGQDKTLSASKNVINQFEKFANQDNKLIIPIPTTGYAAKEIFESEKFKNSYFYKSFQVDFKRLENNYDIKNISNIVTNLILKTRKEPDTI